ERLTAKVSGNRRLDQFKNCRDEIDLLDDGGDAAPRSDTCRLLHDKRDVDDFVIQEETVLMLAVITKAFTIVRHQNDCRAVVQLVSLEVAYQTTDDFVGVSNHAVVRRRTLVSLRRVMGRVHVVQMEEQEESRRALLVEPSLGDGL